MSHTDALYQSEENPPIGAHSGSDFSLDQHSVILGTSCSEKGRKKLSPFLNSRKTLTEGQKPPGTILKYFLRLFETQFRTLLVVPIE